MIITRDNIEASTDTDGTAFVNISPAETPFVVRFYAERDRNPILHSWLRSFWRDRPALVAHVSDKVFYSEHQAAIKDILDRSETITLLSCDPEDEKHLYSWLCAEIRPAELVLHYGWSWNFARGNGCFTALLNKVLSELGDRKLVYTHRSGKARVVADKLGATYNPYRIFA